MMYNLIMRTRQQIVKEPMMRKGWMRTKTMKNEKNNKDENTKEEDDTNDKQMPDLMVCERRPIGSDNKSSDNDDGSTVPPLDPHFKDQGSDSESDRQVDPMKFNSGFLNGTKGIFKDKKNNDNQKKTRKMGKSFFRSSSWYV